MEVRQKREAREIMYHKRQQEFMRVVDEIAAQQRESTRSPKDTSLTVKWDLIGALMDRAIEGKSEEWLSTEDANKLLATLNKHLVGVRMSDGCRVASVEFQWADGVVHGIVVGEPRDG